MTALVVSVIQILALVLATPPVSTLSANETEEVDGLSNFPMQTQCTKGGILAIMVNASICVFDSLKHGLCPH